MGSVPPGCGLLIVVSGWVHRHQLTVIESLQAENRLLKRKLRGNPFGSPMQNQLYLLEGEGGRAQGALAIGTRSCLPSPYWPDAE